MSKLSFLAAAAAACFVSVQVEAELQSGQTQAVADLAFLSNTALEGRATGTTGSLRALEYIEKRFAQLGLSTLPELNSYRQDFDYRNGFNRVVGTNALAWLATADQDALSGTIAITAHYDHIGRHQGRIHPGADDNASGVAALLALAYFAIQSPLQHNLMFIATDAEEKGLIGAKAFFAEQRIDKSQIVANLNLDMLAQLGSRKRLYITGTRSHKAFNGLVAELNDQVAQTLGIRLIKEHRNKRKGREIANNINYRRASDHAVFADNDIAFLFVGVATHRRYHTPQDSFESVDLTTFDDVVELTWALLQNMEQRLVNSSLKGKD